MLTRVSSEPFGLVDRTARGDVPAPDAGRIQGEPLQIQFPVDRPCVTGDRRAAGAVERGEKGSFRSESEAGGRVERRAQNIQSRLVVFARRDGDGALSGGGQKNFGGQNGGGAIRQAKPLQPGQRQDRGVNLAAFRFSQPRLDISAQKDRPKIGAQTQRLRPPPRRGRAEACALRQIGEAFCDGGDERVAHVFARAVADDGHSFRQKGRQILGRMDGAVDQAFEQGCVQFLGEEALSPSFRKRAVEDSIAGRSDGLDGEPLGGKALSGGDGRARLLRLRERERTAAAADPQQWARGHLSSGCKLGRPNYRVGGRREEADDGFMRVLGIETTCDETAAAVVALATRGGDILSNEILSQIAEHAAFGGVVPEIAARAHVEVIDRVVARAMARAGLAFRELDAIAAAAGPGLIGGVLVGLTTGKALALAAGKPFVAVNHLEAHALTARLTDGVNFPYLLLLASGGHTQLIAVRGVGDYRRLGTTLDDAIGEAFDKVAKALELGYPGGPQVERMAQVGDPTRFAFPRPMIGRPDPDFSLSGLKTAVRLEIDRQAAVTPALAADLCASFQSAVVDMVVDRTRAGLRRFRELIGTAPTALVVAGGVASNGAIRRALAQLSKETGLRLVAPPPDLCTDNGAMIAWVGVERLRLGLTDALDVRARPRWPLDEAASRTSGGKG
jgi:N6-L-threonylcarbamoyladenine synthase